MLPHLYYSSFGTTIFKSYAVPNLLKIKKKQQRNSKPSLRIRKVGAVEPRLSGLFDYPDLLL